MYVSCSNGHDIFFRYFRMIHSLNLLKLNDINQYFAQIKLQNAMYKLCATIIKSRNYSVTFVLPLYLNDCIMYTTSKQRFIALRRFFVSHKTYRPS